MILFILNSGFMLEGSLVEESFLNTFNSKSISIDFVLIIFCPVTAFQGPQKPAETYFFQVMNRNWMEFQSL